MAVYKLHIEAVSLADLEMGVLDLARRFQEGSPEAGASVAEALRAPGQGEAAQSTRRRRTPQRGAGDVQGAGEPAVPAAASEGAAGDDAAVQEPTEDEAGGEALAGVEQPAADFVEPDEAEAPAQEGDAAGPAEGEAEEVTLDQVKDAAKALAATPGKGIKALQEVFRAHGVTQPNDVPAAKRSALRAALLEAAE